MPVNQTVTRNTRTIIGPFSGIIKDTDDILNIDTTGGVVSLFLQNIKGSGLQSNPRTIFINDVGNFASVNNITIFGSGGNLVNSNPSLALDINGVSAECIVLNANEWLLNLSGDTGGGGGGTVTGADNGLSLLGSFVGLGGNLNRTTNIDRQGYDLKFFDSVTGFELLEQFDTGHNTIVGGLGNNTWFPNQPYNASFFAGQNTFNSTFGAAGGIVLIGSVHDITGPTSDTWLFGDYGNVDSSFTINSFGRSVDFASANNVINVGNNNSYSNAINITGIGRNNTVVGLSDMVLIGQNNDFLAIDNGGHFLIGYTSVFGGEKFGVSRDQNLEDPLASFSNQDPGSSSSANLRIASDVAQLNVGAASSGNTDAPMLAGKAVVLATNSDIVLGTADDILFFSGGFNQRGIISSTGFVGFGVSAPTASELMNVNGNIFVPDNTGGIFLGDSNKQLQGTLNAWGQGGAPVLDDGVLLYNSLGSNYFYVNGNSNNAAHWFQSVKNGQGTIKTDMIINNDGHVGIGEINPSATLFVRSFGFDGSETIFQLKNSIDENLYQVDTQGRIGIKTTPTFGKEVTLMQNAHIYFKDQANGNPSHIETDAAQGINMENTNGGSFNFKSNGDVAISGFYQDDLIIGALGVANGKGTYLKAYGSGAVLRTGLKYLTNTPNDPDLLLVPDGFGNVGVGMNTVPGAKLQVAGPTSLGQTLFSLYSDDYLAEILTMTQGQFNVRANNTYFKPSGVPGTGGNAIVQIYSEAGSNPTLSFYTDILASETLNIDAEAIPIFSAPFSGRIKIDAEIDDNASVASLSSELRTLYNSVGNPVLNWSDSNTVSKTNYQTGVAFVIAVAKTITHNLNTKGIKVAVWDNTTGLLLTPTIVGNRTANTVDITLGVNVATSDVVISS